jgi:hypothetical protein
MIAALALAIVLVEQPIARGVIWRARDGEVHELILDLDDPDLLLRMVEPGPNTCATVEAIAERAELVDGRPPVAAINFGFFAPWAPCLASSQVISLMQQDGQTLARNFDDGPKGAIGWSIEGELLTTIVAHGDEWPQAWFALGARGILIAEGEPVDAERWRYDEGLAAEFVDVRHPRTAIGVDVEQGRALLVTVDGRRAEAPGMSLLELRESLSANEALTFEAAANLDGGGSTTMWIAGAGVVNQPSDLGGPRAVVGALLIYAAPLEVEAEVRESPERELEVAEPANSGCRAAGSVASPLLLVLAVIPAIHRRTHPREASSTLR